MAIKKHPSVTRLPTLYKKGSTGAIQEWKISVEGTVIVTAFGQVGGKIQKTADSIKTGKNAGRANETDREEQALKEATAKWTKQKKRGYVESIGAARSGETDALIEGGALPMLAKVYEDNISKIAYPVAVQPKLDGHRCIALLSTNGKVTLWSRTRKPIKSVPHIVDKLEYAASKSRNIRDAFPLDGELYSNDLKDDFEKLTSGARKEGGNEISKQLQYHIYDCIQDMDFTARNSLLGDIILLGGSALELVPTKFSNSEEESKMYFTLFTKLGYEGSMVRLLGMPYEQKRSAQLLKVKSFLDSEYPIIGLKEGRGKLQGHCGAFVCNTKDGKIFNAKMSGDTKMLKTYWENPDACIGKLLTVKYQGLTSDGLPRFPVGLRLRDDL